MKHFGHAFHLVLLLANAIPIHPNKWVTGHLDEYEEDVSRQEAFYPQPAGEDAKPINDSFRNKMNLRFQILLETRSVSQHVFQLEIHTVKESACTLFLSCLLEIKKKKGNIRGRTQPSMRKLRRFLFLIMTIMHAQKWKVFNSTATYTNPLLERFTLWYNMR